MAALRYVFANALTGKIIEEVPLQSVSFSNTLSGGELRATFSLDQTGLNNDQLVSATIPGMCFVIAETDNRVYWGGLVWSRTYQSQAKSVQLYAKTLDQYTTKRVITQSRSFTNIGRRNIMRQLYSDMQFEFGSIIVTIPPAFDDGDAVPEFSWDVNEKKSVRAVADQLSTAVDGFEWTIDWYRTGNSYDRVLRMGRPLGALPGDANPVFEYPGNILNYWRNDTIGSGGTNVFGIGAGEGESMPVVEVIHETLLNNGFPRLDTAVSFKDVEDLDALEQLTQTQAAILKVPQPIYTVQMKGDREPAFGDWALGDACRLIIKDPLHPDPGTTYVTRILGWDYSPAQSDGVEEVQLMFQGDEDG